MRYTQNATPNINIGAERGMCLKYVDDTVNAPSRIGTAQESYNREKRNGNIRGGLPPVGVWVPVYFSINRGQWAGLGHVALAFNHGNGIVEIHDSEVHSGKRQHYKSIGELEGWMRNLGVVYLGWSIWCDGVCFVNEIKDDATPQPPADSGSLKPAKGTATVIVDSLNVRAEPSTKSTVVATYNKGQTFAYDGWLIADGFVWLSYVGGSGKRRYVAEGPYNGNKNDVYVRGGIS